MAMLTSGEYSLNKKTNVVQEKKTMLFVKLTDSAQRALNDYLTNLRHCEVPFIEFNKTEGRILIPTCPKANADSEKFMAQFKFDVTSNMAMQGMQGRFECVQHKRNSKQLIKFGQLTQRLRIHANEDVYETTKNRMAAIELEQRKNCTRQLDWSSTSNMISRKVKLERLGRNSTTSTPTIKLEERETKPQVPVAEISNMIRSKNRPVNNAPPQKPNSNACKIRKPLKERIIQMLAVRPYKKVELNLALKQEGLRDCDKAHLSDTLMSVSTLRDNVYHLAKHAWNDVQEDWLFYTEQEKQIVTKNKLRNLTSPSSSDSGVSTCSNQSPNNPSPEDRSPPSIYKRPGYINGADGLPTKRQRISHFVKQEPTTNPPRPVAAEEINAPLFPSLINSRASSELPAKDRVSQRSSKMANTKGSSQPAAAAAAAAAAESSRKEVPAVVICSPEITSTSNGVEDYPLSRASQAAVTEANRNPPQNQFAQPPQKRKMVGEKPKYMKEYVTITDMEQRQKYKSDFNEIFKEYGRVHGEVDSISNVFAQMGESLKQHKKGSSKYNKIEAEIFKKYYAFKQSEKFQAAKRRFEYLHEKLSHIKQLVHDYDEQNFFSMKKGDTNGEQA